MVSKVCINCKKEFKVHACHIERGKRKGREEGQFCSRRCYFEHKKNITPKSTITCLNCNKEFTLIKSDADYTKRKFCSRRCVSTYFKPRVNFSKKINGYNYVYKPDHPNTNTDGYVAEHRLVMEERVGHYISKDLHVHHINHVKDDNRIENLQLLTRKEHEAAHLEHKRGIQKAYWTPERKLAASIRNKKRWQLLKENG
jgi:hypothetical protein